MKEVLEVTLKNRLGDQEDNEILANYLLDEEGKSSVSEMSELVGCTAGATYMGTFQNAQTVMQEWIEAA